MTRVLVTGAAGMLGSQLLLDAPAGVEALGVDLREGPGVAAAGVDLAEPEAVEGLLERLAPVDGVIHAAAYTAVDKAESEPDLAHRVNATACGVLAEACARRGTRLVAVGTDFVFDGTRREPYRPDDEPSPLGVYGRTKLEGERLALSAWADGTAVVRTQWLYGPRGAHFPGTIVRLARERGQLKVVSDQVGSPTTTLELSPALWDVLASRETGIFHAACEGACSWYDLAVATLELVGLGAVPVEPCGTDEFPRPAPRPAYSVLECSRLTAQRGRPLAGWREALEAFVAVEPL